ncbi:MAG: GAF domain-containing sensor histidine kinase [Chloroflexi bacterium]|nr:GAF domain-containing sensor histidine kinase [Chloroflexota bacterium]
MAFLDASRSELRRTLDLILTQLAVVVEHESAAVLLQVNDRMELVAARGYAPAQHEAMVACPLSDSALLQQVLSASRPTVFGGHLDQDPFYAVACHGHNCSCLNVPLRVQDRAIGLLTINRHAVARNLFTLVEGQMLEAFAEQAALTIENARLVDEARRLATHVEAGAEVARRLTLLHDLDELMAETVRVIRDTFGYDRVHILLIDPSGERLLLKEASGPGSELIKQRGFNLRVGVDGITGWVAASGEPLLCNDVSREPRFMPDDLAGGTRAELAVPLRLRGRPIGVLDVQNFQPGSFHRDDVAALQLIGDQVAIAIENARLFTETRSRLAAMRALHDVSLDIVAQLELGELLGTLLQRATRLVQAEAAAIYQYKPASGTIGNIASFQTGSGWTASPLRVGVGLVGRVVQDGLPLIVYNYPAWAHSMPQYVTHPLVMRMAVPLRWQSEVIGALMVLNPADGHRFTPDDQQMLSAFADLSAIALKNADLYAQVSTFGRRLEAQVAERTSELELARQEIVAKAEQVEWLLSKTVHIQEEERARIARDLHDSVTQLAIGALYELQAAKSDLNAARSGPALEKIDTTRDLLKQIEREIRQAIHDLRPILLDAGGLPTALHRYAESVQALSGLRVTVTASGTPCNLPAAIEVVIFRIAQEALHNVTAHAHATRADVALDFGSEVLILEVSDDGQGFDLAHLDAPGPGRHVGLAGMRERASVIGGALEIESAPGRGARVRLRVNLRRTFAAAPAFDR